MEDTVPCRYQHEDAVPRHSLYEDNIRNRLLPEDNVPCQCTEPPRCPRTAITIVAVGSPDALSRSWPLAKGEVRAPGTTVHALPSRECIRLGDVLQ